MLPRTYLYAMTVDSETSFEIVPHYSTLPSFHIITSKRIPKIQRPVQELLQKALPRNYQKALASGRDVYGASDLEETVMKVKVKAVNNIIHGRETFFKLP